MNTPQRILVVRPDALGDVTLMIPLINSLKKTCPNAEIYTLQQSYTKALLDNHPHVKEVIIDWKKSGKAKGLYGFWGYVSYIKSFKFDAVVYSYLDEYYALLGWLAGIPKRVGDGNKLMLRALLTHPIKQDFRQLTRHETEQNLAFLSAFSNAPLISLSMNLCVNPSAQINAELNLKKWGWAGESLICVHPTTGGGNRAWLPEKYAELINLIQEDPQKKVILTGFGQHDERVVTDIIKRTERLPINTVNKTSLEELKAIIQKCEVVIGTDTGPTHMAAALGIPVLCVSPTKFVKSLRWGPWQTSNRIVGHPESCDLVCNPYRCREPYCLQAISEKDVVRELEILLKETTFSLQKAKQHWLQKSTTVLIYVDDISAMPEAIAWHQSLKKQGQRVHFGVANAKLGGMYDGIDYVGSAYNLLKLIQYIVHQDLNIIHLFSERPKSTWFWFIRQLSAPKLYVPPIIVTTRPKQGEDNSRFYMLEFDECPQK